MVDLLTTEEVARLAGVGTTAVKRWSDQGVLACVRTPGGHRRFAREEVERLLASGAVHRSRRLADALLALPSLALESRLLEERARMGAWRLVVGALAEALAEVGRRWAEGTVGIADEHAASERLTRALSRIADGLPAARGAPAALLAAADGDQHLLGLRLAELCLREAGWGALFAGPSLPAEEVARVARSGQVQLVALSASGCGAGTEALAAEARIVGAACEAAGLPLALGGAGPWPDPPPYGLRFRALEPFAAWAAGLLRPAA